MHFQPVRHEEINAGKVDPANRSPARKLRKASSIQQTNHQDQHGYMQAKNEHEHEHEHEHEREDRDPLSKFGGLKHSVIDDHELIARHRQRKAEATGIVFVTPKMSPKLTEYLREKDKEDLQSGEGDGSVKLRSILHQVASNGDLVTTQRLLKGKTPKEMELLVNAQDARGWQPIHEAIRGGHKELVNYLVETCGASLEMRTGRAGGTPLWWARRVLDPRHSIIAFLVVLGAPEEGNDI